MSRTLAVSLALLGCAAPHAAAQAAPLAGPRLSVTWASAEPDLSPRQDRWRTAVESRPEDVLVGRAARPRAPGTVLMIVGGAVAIAGLVADESLLVVGGVVVGAYGLYLYLR